MRNGRERRPPGPARAVPPPLLAAERGGDVSCVPSVGFGGVWGTSPAPRPRTAWRLPTEGEGSSVGLRVRAGLGIDRGGRGTARLPGTPARRWRLPLERGCGEEEGKQAPGKPRGRWRSWLSFRLWLASGALGAAEPRCARGLARAGSAGCQRRAAIVRSAEPRPHAAAPARGPEPGGGQAPQGTPGRARGRGRASGGGGKRPLPPGPPLSADCEGNRIPLPCAAREPVPGSRRLPGASKEEDTS